MQLVRLRLQLLITHLSLVLLHRTLRVLVDSDLYAALGLLQVLLTESPKDMSEEKSRAGEAVRAQTEYEDDDGRIER